MRVGGERPIEGSEATRFACGKRRNVTDITFRVPILGCRTLEGPQLRPASSEIRHFARDAADLIACPLVPQQTAIDLAALMCLMLEKVRTSNRADGLTRGEVPDALRKPFDEFRGLVRRFLDAEREGVAVGDLYTDANVECMRRLVGFLAKRRPWGES